jgi:hypothetical protein
MGILGVFGWLKTLDSSFDHKERSTPVLTLREQDVLLTMVDKGIKIFAGNSNIELAADIAAHAKCALGKCSVSNFSNGETSVMISESGNGSL